MYEEGSSQEIYTLGQSDQNVSSGVSARRENMDDVSSRMKSDISEYTLTAAGMDEVALPIQMDLPEIGSQTLFAKARITVNTVDGSIKGIHMSRLFLSVTEKFESKTFSSELLEDVLMACKDSHEGISDRTDLKLSFALPMKRPSLKSGLAGWRLYPVTITASVDDKNQFTYKVNLNIKYASFCPCSASLARQLIQEKFLADFGGETTQSTAEISEWLRKASSIAAVPHGQRSTATVSFDTKKLDGELLSSTVALLEDAIKTPVQTAVKRQDEQEFARLCAENLIFVEDAVKIFYKAIKTKTSYTKVKVDVAHHESLHAHDAVASISD